MQIGVLLELQLVCEYNLYPLNVLRVNSQFGSSHFLSG